VHVVAHATATPLTPIFAAVDVVDVAVDAVRASADAVGGGVAMSPRRARGSDAIRAHASVGGARAMPADLFKTIVAKTAESTGRHRRRRPSFATPRAADDDADARGDGLVTPIDVSSTGARRRKLGSSVSIVGDDVGEEVVSRDVPTTIKGKSTASRAPLRAMINGSAEEGEDIRRKQSSSSTTTTTTASETSGKLMYDAERSLSSHASASAAEDGGSEDDVSTEPLPAKTTAKTARTPVTAARFDRELALADDTKRALRATMTSIRKSGLDPARVFETLARQAANGSGDFEALARAIDALESPAERKRLSFSAATTTTMTTDIAVTRDESSESFGSAEESFDDTVGDGDEEVEGTFPPCECGVAECAIEHMRARGGPFRLPTPSSGVDHESIVETDDEERHSNDEDADESESVAGTEDGNPDANDLGDAMEALRLQNDDDHDVDQEVMVERTVPTHIRFDDSHVSDSPDVASARRPPRARAARRKVILDEESSDEDEDEAYVSEDDEKEDADDDKDEETSESPDVRTRPRRAAATKKTFPARGRSVFIDDDASASDEFDFDDEYDDDDEEANTSDDDFINDEDDDGDLSDYAVEYDSEAENVTPAPRREPKADLVDEMNDKLSIDPYSPSNLQTPTPPKEMSPRSTFNAFKPPPTHSKALQSALKSVAKKGAEKFNFNRHKDALAGALFAEFNANVFDDQLPVDFDVSWNNKLLTTAGLTHYKRSSKTGETVYSARIELSTKVLDTVEKLEATLLHEMCHASAWLVDKIAKPPHGPVFKKWATLAMRTYPETNVSTCHAYAIHQPYKWRCTREWCQQEYGRHSKSIDITKKACGACGGKLEYLGKFKKNGQEVQTRAPTAFSLFVKEHFKATKDALGAGTPHASVMKTLSKRWKDAKPDEIDAIEIE